MAKKKGKREEGFTFPEFDKEEFRQKELRDSKVILFAVFYALVMAVISYYLVRMTSLERSVMLFGFIAFMIKPENGSISSKGPYQPNPE